MSNMWLIAMAEHLAKGLDWTVLPSICYIHKIEVSRCWGDHQLNDA